MRWHMLLIILALSVTTRRLPAATPAPAPAEPLISATTEDRALAARADRAVAAVGETPGREAANFIRTGWMHNLYRLLQGEREGTAKEFAFARERIGELTAAAEKGPGWPALPRLKVPRAGGKVQFDGKLDEPAWRKAATWKEVYLLGDPARRTTPATTWRVMWDDQYLYFAFTCEDTDIQSPVMKRDDRAWEHDGVEMFILPKFDTGAYWELVVGASGSIFDELHYKLPDQWGFADRGHHDLEGLQVGIAIDGTLNQPGDADHGYTIEVGVPFRELPEHATAPPRVGQTLRVLLARVDQTGDEVKYYNNFPTLSWNHNIWNYPTFELVR